MQQTELLLHLGGGGGGGLPQHLSIQPFIAGEPQKLDRQKNMTAMF